MIFVELKLIDYYLAKLLDYIIRRPHTRKAQKSQLGENTAGLQDS